MLDIGLASGKTTTPYPAMSLAFDDDGYYWFCHPYFEELATRTGEMIDLYGAAWFAGDQLDALVHTLERIAAEASRRPERWRESVGERGGEPLEQAVDRARLLERIGAFRELAEEARRASRWIACLGD